MTIKDDIRAKESRRLYDKTRYYNRKRSGLCVRCGEKALLGVIFCPNCQLKHSLSARKCDSLHREQRRIKAEEYRKRRKAKGRCIRCGVSLIEGEVGYCFNCLIFRHEGIIKGVLREVNYETTAKCA